VRDQAVGEFVQGQAEPEQHADRQQRDGVAGQGRGLVGQRAELGGDRDQQCHDQGQQRDQEGGAAGEAGGPVQPLQQGGRVGDHPDPAGQQARTPLPRRLFRVPLRVLLRVLPSMPLRVLLRGLLCGRGRGGAGDALDQAAGVQQAQQLLPLRFAEPGPEVRGVLLADLGQGAGAVEPGDDEVLLRPDLQLPSAVRVPDQVDLGGAAPQRPADPQLGADPGRQVEQAAALHGAAAGRGSRSARAST
jgi:hypothetical protein